MCLSPRRSTRSTRSSSSSSTSSYTSSSSNRSILYTDTSPPSISSNLDIFDTPQPLHISDLQSAKSDHRASDHVRLLEYDTVTQWVNHTASEQELRDLREVVLRALVPFDIVTQVDPEPSPPAKRMKFDDVKVPKSQRKFATHDDISPEGLRELDDLQRSMSTPARNIEKTGPYKATFLGRAGDMKFANPVTTMETNDLRNNRHPAVDISRVTFVRDESNGWMDLNNIRAQVGSDKPTQLDHVSWYQLFKSGMGIPAYVQLAALTHGITQNKPRAYAVAKVIKALCTGGLEVVMLDVDAQPQIEPIPFGPELPANFEQMRAKLGGRKKKVSRKAQAMMNAGWGEVTHTNVLPNTRAHK